MFVLVDNDCFSVIGVSALVDNERFSVIGVSVLVDSVSMCMVVQCWWTRNV